MRDLDWARLGKMGLMALAGMGVSLATSIPAKAQVRPDGTLGAESSRVRAVPIRGRDNVVRDSDLIEGGARRQSVP